MASPHGGVGGCLERGLRHCLLNSTFQLSLSSLNLTARAAHGTFQNLQGVIVCLPIFHLVFIHLELLLEQMDAIRDFKV